MSQHTYSTQYQSRPIRITLGYDRPLRNVFMTVLRLDAGDDEDEVVYSNLGDSGAGTDCDDVDYFRRVLQALNITVPESMFVETLRDQVGDIGNRTVDHTKHTGT